MRYQEKAHENSKHGIVTIIDTKQERSWDIDVVTVYNLNEKKNRKSDMILKALNMRDEIGPKPENKTKAELLQIIKKYI